MLMPLSFLRKGKTEFRALLKKIQVILESRSPCSIEKVKSDSVFSQNQGSVLWKFDGYARFNKHTQHTCNFREQKMSYPAYPNSGAAGGYGGPPPQNQGIYGQPLGYGASPQGK